MQKLYSFSCYYSSRWQLCIKWGFKWSDLMLIYLHNPAISRVSLVHLRLYTLQCIKETDHLLFFTCSWNNHLDLQVGNGCCYPLKPNHSIIRLSSWRGPWGQGHERHQSQSSRYWWDHNTCFLGLTQPNSEKDNHRGEGYEAPTACAKVTTLGCLAGKEGIWRSGQSSTGSI